MRKSKICLLLVGLAVTGTVAGHISFGSARGSMTDERISKVTVVEQDDVPGLEAWARAICKDTTVEQLASILGVAPKMETVVARMMGRLPREGAQAVARVCRAELRDENAGAESGGGDGSR